MRDALPVSHTALYELEQDGREHDSMMMPAQAEFWNLLEGAKSLRLTLPKRASSKRSSLWLFESAGIMQTSTR